KERRVLALRDFPVRQLRAFLTACAHLDSDVPQTRSGESQPWTLLVHRATDLFHFAERSRFELVDRRHESILTSKCFVIACNNSKMAGRLLFPEEIYNYLASVSVREPELLRRLREETAPLPRASMQITADQ